MNVHHVVRWTGNRWRALIMAAALTAMLAIASPALATEHHPTGEFAPFAQCPLSNPTVEQCIVAQSSSGKFVVGKKTVPIENTITLQGGFHENEEGVQEFHGAENGDTLSKTPQTVPGGLLGIKAPESWPVWLQEWFNEFINKGLTGLTETTELAKPATDIGISTTNLLFEKGIALSLPVKVKLNNTLLGKECYIGSEADPINLELTTGTTKPPEGETPNKPIKGSRGEIKFNPEFTLITLSGGSLVDNTFSAPGVSGCGEGLSFLFDPLVNSILGTPSPSGYNTAILSGKLEQANAEAVKASE
jgi:hypothetical protein